MELFDLSHTLARPLFDRVARPWEVLALLSAYILDLGPQLGPEFEQVAEAVWVGKGTTIHPSAVLQGPAIVGRDGEIRPGAFVRPSVAIRFWAGGSTSVPGSSRRTTRPGAPKCR